jgi:two-component system response regulator DesR
MIRVALAEDQRLLLSAIASLLELEDDIEVIGRFSDGQSARDELGSLGPDVVLTDIEMPGMTGLELAEFLKRDHPEVRVVILTTFARPGYLRRALDAGVRAYLLKETPAEELAGALRRVVRGERVIAPELALTAFDGRDPLTERERQALRLAGTGASNADIARQLHLAEGTVRNYLSEAMSKLHAENRIEAYRIARDQGWL